MDGFLDLNSKTENVTSGYRKLEFQETIFFHSEIRRQEHFYL